MTCNHFLIAWLVFLVVVYTVMICEALYYNRELRDSVRRLNEVLTEEEDEE